MVPPPPGRPAGFNGDPEEDEDDAKDEEDEDEDGLDTEEWDHQPGG